MKLYCNILSIFIIIGSLFLSACSDNNEEFDNPEIPKVQLFEIEPNSIRIAKGSTIQLIAKLNGVPVKNNEVEWNSITNLIDVDDMGMVTAVDFSEFMNGFQVSAKLIKENILARCRVEIYVEYEYQFRLTLKDKNTSRYSINKPEEFLSNRAIERRKKHNIPISETDIPISSDYIKEIEKVGGTIVAKSKWLNTVTVSCDPQLEEKYKALPFVEDVVWVGRKERDLSKSSNKYKNESSSSNYNIKKSATEYGSAWDNIVLNNGQVLHQKGFKGQGIDIAVIDAGFNSLTTNPTLKNMNLKGVKSFIYNKTNPYLLGDHGIWVSSCMATNKPGYYVGTAPESNYWFLSTEDEDEELPLEQDYWVTAIEYADSVGVDIVNTSLYYVNYDYPFEDPKYEEMDGKTAYATRSANMAADKGIFIVCCSGNHGSWVGTPSDSPYVLTVGSVFSGGRIGHFTAFGMTVDGRIKPDIVSLGSGAEVISINGEIDIRSGSSYASPIVCGLAACLWGAYPSLTNNQLREIIVKSSDRYQNPELPYGYGIPDMQKAMELAKTYK